MLSNVVFSQYHCQIRSDSANSTMVFFLILEPFGAYIFAFSVHREWQNHKETYMSI